MGQGGGQGGVDGGGDQRAVWEQQSVHWFHLLGSLKNLTIGLIWLVTRGGGVGGVGQGGGQGAVDGIKLNNWSDLAGDEGGGVGGVGQGGGQGGVDGGGHQRAVGATRRAPFTLTIGLIWLVTRGGGVGGVGQEAGKGLVIWLVTRGGEAWGVWAREAGKGGVDGGGSREQCGSNKAFTGSTFSAPFQT